MINSRPLTYLSNENCDEHINPSKLMYGWNINRRNIVDDNDSFITLDKKLIITRIKHVTHVNNHFWNRFETEKHYHYVKNIDIIKTIK